MLKSLSRTLRCSPLFLAAACLLAPNAPPPAAPPPAPAPVPPAPVKAAVYEQKGKIGENDLKGLAFVACDADNRLVVLLDSGKVKLYDRDGKPAGEFATGMEKPSVLACGDGGEIFVLAATRKVEPATTGPRKGRPVSITESVACKVFDRDGKTLREMPLPDVKACASAAIAQKTLLVADNSAREVLLLDPATGRKKASIGKGIRLCCGIFGVNADSKGNILVANLGAFRVLRLDPAGKELGAFGKRGEDESSFQSCCNPVNVVELPDGRLMTAEKHDTLLKIFSADGARCEQALKDVQKLVEGCSYIPMAVDSGGNVYLGNTSKGYVVKCGPAGKPAK